MTIAKLPALLLSIAFLNVSTAFALNPVESVIQLIDKDKRIEKIELIERLPPEIRIQVKCTALTIYVEARSSTPEDQMAVGHVVKNRVQAEGKIYPKTFCAVINQHRTIQKNIDGINTSFVKAQFQWVKKSVNSLLPLEGEPWRKSLLQAYLIVTDPDNPDPTDGATHFCALRINPGWDAISVKVIGAHKYMILRDPSADKNDL